jgi:hypothetical protein
MAATGSIEIDFGTLGSNGANEASVAITGQSAILSTSAAEAWIMREDSTNHTANDQAYIAAFTSITCGVPTDGVGFTIYGTSTEKLTGKVKVRWVWA